MRIHIILTTLFILLVIPISTKGYQVSHVTLWEAKDKVREFLPSINEDNLIIIMGSKLSVSDQIFFTIMKTQINTIRNIEFQKDTCIEEVEELNETYIVLLGGSKTNVLTNQLIDTINISEKLIAPPVNILLGLEEDAEKKIVILYTLREEYNNLNKAVERSPLNPILGTGYTPIAATATSIILLYIWNTISGGLVELASDYTSESIIDRITILHKKRRKRDLSIHRIINPRETVAVIASAIVFSIAMSWTWSNELTDLLGMFLLNLIIIGSILLLRETLRQYLCYRYNVKTEHVFWPFGALLTLTSTFLGNTFSLASYTMIDEEEEKSFGRIVYLISIILYVFVLVVFLWNLFYPSIILQMMFTYTIMMLFIDFFPLPPMDGYDIRKWNLKAWIILYTLIIISYISINFTTLII
ncbi:MAG TPA: hypothetical protein ENG62_03305 [Thermoplasmatales archaeon]|nr:hypothetical protein [Thermoplasmatales archaeon]